ncbi:protein IRC23 [Kluyveromyces marxianus]|uniref:Protein IRC23 n=1 Tax=Kluyveromyces marxianus TaxID=4911 RepID=A0ABX6EUQ1_KLUMA|nr:protein IRC23 [Kluyveromyces marxianus]
MIQFATNALLSIWHVFQLMCRTLAWTLLIPMVLLYLYDFSLYAYRITNEGLERCRLKRSVRNMPSRQTKLFHRGEL